MAMALLLALATQLRIAGAGPGVALLALCIALALGLALWRGAAGVRGDALSLFAFWALLAAAMSLGSIASTVRAFPVDVSLVSHDIGAYMLLTLLTLSFATLPERAQRLRRIQWWVAVFGACLSALQFANALGLISLPGVDPWYWDRMRGWAENPNQFALLSLLVGFCAVALIDGCETRAQKAAAALSAAVALGVGFQAKSNAYALMVAAGLLVYLALKGVRALSAAERSGIPAIGAALMLASTAGFALTLVSAQVNLRTELKSMAGDMARKGDDESADAALRLALWRQAVEVGWNSGGFGLGPGPHLAIPQSLIAARKAEREPKYVEHPKEGVAPNFEAHNTVLELFVQGGALAVGAFAWILATAVRRAWRAGQDGVIALIVATIAFGSFHVVFRHPLVWFCLCLGVLAESARAPDGALGFKAGRAAARRFHPYPAERGAPT
jgi:hypothetical protein